MQVTIGSNIKIKNPSVEIISWCQKHLKLNNPEYAKKARMGFYIGNTPKFLFLYEVHGDEIILPYGTLKQIQPMIQDAIVTSDFKSHESIDYGQPVPLYPYQEQAVEAVKQAYYGILQSKAGSGKTQMGIALIKKFGRRALWLTTTKDLLNQSKERAERYMNKSLIGTITEGKVNIGKGVTFATIQTMCKLDLAQYKDMWDVIIVDECFPENTMIQTSHGEVPIQYILPGEFVVTRNDVTGKLELCQVEELQIRELKGDLVKITLTDGKEIVCTANHPFFTQYGYKKAGDLTNDDEVRMLRKNFRYLNVEQNPTIRCSKRGKTPPLFQRMFNKVESLKFNLDGKTERDCSTNDAKDKLHSRIRANESEQSYGKPRSESENVNHIKTDGSQAHYSRWKWARINRSPNDANREFISIQTSSRVCNTDQVETRGLSHSLQNRHSTTHGENSNRGRWWLSLFSKGSDSRYEKNGVLTKVRVASVEVLKSGCDGTFGGLCKNHKVYNLSVTHNHNYFANGVLVHNCHRVAGTPTAMTQFSKVLNSLSARHKFGLSATVHRADGVIEATYALLGDVVYAVPDEAVADKVMRVGIVPISTGVGISRECLNTDGTLNYTKLINYLCKNDARNHIICEYLVAESDKSWLILSDRLEHLGRLIALLPPTMQPYAVMISGKMTSKKGKAEREQALEDMRTGKKKYLFATYSLAKEGLDIPCLERLFMATPQKDFAVITQSIGRIARTCEGKADPICYDFVDDIGYLIKSYKKRCATYKKNDCYFIGD